MPALTSFQVPSLPADAEGQTFVTVQALHVGGLWLPYREVFQDSLHEPFTVGSDIPFIAFLITHPAHGRILFDLGLRRKCEGYPPAMKPTLEEFKPWCEEDVVDLLRKQDIEPSQIDKIIFSHLHWDHTGDPTPFTSAELILGAEGKPLLENAYPVDPNSRITVFPPDRRVTLIDFSSTSPHRVISPFATFDRAVDLFDDGSLYLIDTPGHMPGHIAALARVAPNGFVLLAGDTCHNRLSYAPGVRELSEENHADVVTARKTVNKLTKLNDNADNVIVILAHEQERTEEMPFFPHDLKDWVVEEIRKRAQRRATAGVA